MPGESSKRSNIVDVTYSELHSILLGHREGLTKEHVSDILRPRVEQLKNISEPFGKPSDASRKQLDSGSVTLADRVVLRVDDVDKTAATAISDRFQIDQVQSLVLFRAFIYNEGLPTDALSDSNASFTEQLIEVITPFYLSERLHILRTLIPLFRADANEADFAHHFSQEFLPSICPERGRGFVKALIAEYQRKTQTALPTHTNGDPRSGSLWAKQSSKEQLMLLEILFWAMWSRVTCDGPIVMRIFETAYETQLGHTQQNSSYLLDQEGVQLQQDSAALWILITVEILELETIADRIDISGPVDDDSIYIAYPESLQRIHDLVTSNGDSQYACTYMAWTFVLSRLHAGAAQLNDIPQNYRQFFASLEKTARASYTKDSLPLHDLMSRTCLEPGVGLLKFMLSILTESPLFVTGVALKTGSAVTDPNNVAFRSVFKGLVMSLVELVPVEMIPEFDVLVDVWIALFGRSEPSSVEGICQQFWAHDAVEGISRRAIFDATRTRFPIQPRHLLRLLRSLTATGFLDTDPLSISDHSFEGQPPSELQLACTSKVYDYFHNLSTFTQVIPMNQCTGAHALYEKLSERFNSPYGVAYTNTRPIKLPGGSTLPVRSNGRVISGDTADFVVVLWQHQHSGWKLALEILTDYANRRCTYYGTHVSTSDASSRRGGGAVALRLQDVGVELDAAGDEAVVIDILDLIRGVIQDNSTNARILLEFLESGDPVVSHTTNEVPPDLVQLTTMILEEALSRSNQPRSATRTRLITSALSVLASLLSLSEYSLRVWLYIRSTSSLFGSDRAIGFASSVLASERAIGHYTMTLSLLHLVQQLFNQASSTLLVDEPKALQVKEEVLLRAARFVHAEIWVEHTGWKYAQLGDRFEIGRRIASLYSDILTHSPPNLIKRPLATLSQAVIEGLLYKSSMSTINPLVSSLATAGSVIGTLYASRRHGDARRLIYLLESHLRLTRLILNCKEKSVLSTKPCLLEQALCGKVTGGAASVDIGRSKLDPIDVLASYVTERRMGLSVPVEAMRVLHALCSSLSTSQPSPPTLIGHLSNPEATVLSLVRIVQHPYDELGLRIAVWNFISLAVDREPALSGLFVTGHFQTPSFNGKGKGSEVESNKKEVVVTSKSMNAVEIATAMLEGWKELWDSNAKLLACLLNFLDVVWEHGLEHRNTLSPLRGDSKFWRALAACSREELGPLPDYVTQGYTLGDDGSQRSDLHDAVSSHAYRTIAKSHALHIIALDVGIFARKSDSSISSVKPASYLAIESVFNSEEELTDYILEATVTPYDPALYDELLEDVQAHIPALTLEQLQIQDPIVEREFGDNFNFSRQLLNSRLRLDPVEIESLDMKLTSINLNLSLSHAQMALTESWQYLLLQVVAYLRGNSAVRMRVLTLIASISASLSTEKRSGDMMSTIHGKRLSLLLALLEVAWFSTTDKKEEVEQFMLLVKNLHGIILSETQSPAKSFLGKVTVPFHRTLLQIIYFCTRQCRNLSRRAKLLSAEQRLTITAMLEAALNLVIDALRMVFESARSRLDLDLDQDMELLVAVFEQCTRPEVNPSSVLWLTRCQETNVIRASSELFAHTDVVGLSDLSLLRARRQPLYAPHILAFHMSLASLTSSAERLASDGVLMAYSDNSISSAIRAGMIDVSIPELPGERSPAHKAYCSMLAIISGVSNALGSQNHFFDAEASAFIQLYGDQISRALSWSIGDSLTLPYLEELEQVVNLFHAIARNLPLLSKPNENVMRVLKVFTTHALSLLQQLNYALTHPNHLASLLEPVTAEERTLIEKDRTSTFQSSSEIIDPMKRPFLTRLIHRLFRLTSGIISTLTDVSGAEKVLMGEQDDWPLSEALVVPHSKVVLGEPASMGTLLELGNCTLDILRLLIDRPPGQAITPANAKPAVGSYEKPLDVRDAVSVTRQNLEVVVVYAVTQLAMWLSKPDYDANSAATSNEMDTDDQGPEISKGSESVSGAKERRGNRRVSTVTLADRLRRGMTGEMASDLQSLLIKAKPAISKSQVILGTKDAVDISDVLSHFLQERILAP